MSSHLCCCFFYIVSEYAHTLLELMYHPQVYKTGLCDHFAEENPATWKCVWKRRCAHAHGKNDLRTKEDSTEEWKNHLRTHTSGLSLTLSRLLNPQNTPLLTGQSSGGGNTPTPTL